jgi:dihydropteroate synthase
MTIRITLRPIPIEAGAAPAGALPLAGGRYRFGLCEAVARDLGGAAPIERARDLVAPDEALAWAAQFGPDCAQQAERALAALCGPRVPFAGLSLARPRLMGILNVTPDSFSDGGDRFDAGRAVADGLAMIQAGAAILDVGGESTRPGAAPVDQAEELRRTLPVVRALAEAGALVSIDTRRARVMAEALAAGARIVNDVTALDGDPRSLATVAGAGASVVLMHMRGEPRTMQRDPSYADAPLDIHDYLAARVEACEAAGIPRARIALDPGIGFGKTLVHNLRVLDQLAVFHGIGCPLMLGVSRKSFIAKAVSGPGGAPPPKARLPGSLAAGLAGLARGVQILRVHDVAETAQALTIWNAIQGAQTR